MSDPSIRQISYIEDRDISLRVVRNYLRLSYFRLSADRGRLCSCHHMSVRHHLVRRDDEPASIGDLDAPFGLAVDLHHAGARLRAHLIG